MIKDTLFNYKIRITATVIKNDLKYIKMSEGNTCIGKPNLEELPLA